MTGVEGYEGAHAVSNKLDVVKKLKANTVLDFSQTTQFLAHLSAPTITHSPHHHVPFMVLPLT